MKTKQPGYHFKRQAFLYYQDPPVAEVNYSTAAAQRI